MENFCRTITYEAEENGWKCEQVFIKAPLGDLYVWYGMLTIS